MTRDILYELEAEVCRCEPVLRNNLDFLTSEIDEAMDGIKWFVQEYLPSRLKGEQ